MRPIRLALIFLVSLAGGLLAGHGVAALTRLALDPAGAAARLAPAARLALSLRLADSGRPPIVLRPLVEGPALETLLARRGPPAPELPPPAPPPPAPLADPRAESDWLMPAAPPRLPVSLPAEGPLLALVIDDIGFDWEAGLRAIDLPAPVTLAILPNGRFGPALGRRARERGHEIILHLPMEPIGAEDPGAMALITGLPEGEILRRLRWSLARVPGVAGVNNHMGSRFTQDARGLRPVMREIAAQGLFFLDSVTIADSRAFEIAAASGAAALRRDVFLDHRQDERAIFARLVEAEEIARARGTAIAIGHPYPETLAMIEIWIDGAAARGLRLVSLAALARAKAGDPARVASLPPDGGAGTSEGFLGGAE